jgi:hypothetical protein
LLDSQEDPDKKAVVNNALQADDKRCILRCFLKKPACHDSTASKHIESPFGASELPVRRQCRNQLDALQSLQEYQALSEELMSFETIRRQPPQVVVGFSFHDVTLHASSVSSWPVVEAFRHYPKRCVRSCSFAFRHLG